MPSNQPTSRVAWAFGWKRFTIGRIDALDAGWCRNGKLHRFLTLAPYTPRPDIVGVCLIVGKRQYASFLDLRPSCKETSNAQ